MQSFDNVRVPHTIFGNGSLDSVGTHLKNRFEATKCLVVTDAGIVKLGFAERVVNSIKAEGIECDVYSDTRPEPPDWQCLEVRKIILEGGYDAVVGLGGGSSMDLAKGACIMAAVPGEIDDIHEYRRSGTLMKETYKRPVTLITMPTTSATGAESTMTGVFCAEAHGGVKMSIGSENTIADMAIIDPLLTVGLPQRPTVNGAFDILGHCMENVVGVLQSEFSNMMMLNCMERVWKWLPVAVRDPQNVEAREQLSWASHFAECSGSLPNGHAVAHAVGVLYEIVHGHTCAMVLPTVYRHFAHSPEAAESIQAVAKIVGVPATGNQVEDAENIALAIEEFAAKFGLETLQEVLANKGIKDTKEEFIEKAIPLVLDDFKSELWNPPIHNNREELVKVLGMVYDGK